jgi:putative lipoic acid-binding regulatory protein
MARTRGARIKGKKSRGGPTVSGGDRGTPAVRDPWQGAAGPGAGPEVQASAAGASAANADVVAQDPAAKLAAELAGLAPAERYERLIDFPTDHPFKVIGAADQSFTDRLRAALGDLGHAGAALQPRYSSSANYVAYTITLRVADGAAMVRIYEVLGALPGLKYLL